MAELKEIVAQSKLVALDVVHCVWQRAHPSTTGPLSHPAELTQHLNINVRTPEAMPPGGAAFLCTAQVKWTAAAKPDDVVAAGEVHIRVAYSFADAALVLTPVEAGAFNRDVALHQAWPYLRHRLQLMCMELGINPVPLPLRPLRDSESPIADATLGASAGGTAPT